VASFTPIKKEPELYQGGLFCELSPLPLPRKIEYHSTEPVYTYSQELRYVETPIVKEHSKYMPIQGEDDE
jgi:hypothetical protein